MLERIKKGTHKRFRFPKIRLGESSLSGTACFIEAEYDLKDEDQKDINKLTGFSLGYHKKNSVRIGWRWDKEKRLIELFNYVYRDGERIINPLISVKEEEVFSFEIKYTSYTGLDWVVMTTIRTKDASVSDIVDSFKDRFFSYQLFPYFGGNEKAPNDIILDLSIEE